MDGEGRSVFGKRFRGYDCSQLVVFDFLWGQCLFICIFLGIFFLFFGILVSWVQGRLGICIFNLFVGDFELVVLDFFMRIVILGRGDFRLVFFRVKGQRFWQEVGQFSWFLFLQMCFKGMEFFFWRWSMEIIIKNK